MTFLLELVNICVFFSQTVVYVHQRFPAAEYLLQFRYEWFNEYKKKYVFFKFCSTPKNSKYPSKDEKNVSVLLYKYIFFRQ